LKRAGVKLLVIGLTVLGLSAGVVAGMLMSRVAGGAGDKTVLPISNQPTPLVEELALTSDQQREMKRIWEDVRRKVKDCYVRADQLQRQRDDEILGILTEEQKAKFAKIAKRFHDLDVTITAEREQIFNDAINQTRKLLTDEQRTKYDKILKARLGRVPTTGPVASAWSHLDLLEAREP
jgi:hypothetical protein